MSSTSGSKARPDTGDFRTEFRDFMQNREKTRERGFVVFVRGGVGLEPFERSMSEQSYNKVRSARYQAETGRVVLPLLRRFALDVGGTARPPSEAGPVGFLSPEREDPLWETISSATGGLRTELAGASPGPFFEAMRGALTTGDRLVLLCELPDLPADATLESLGLDADALDLPERLGLVFSGIPEEMEVPDLPFVLDLRVPDGYEEHVAPERSQPVSNDRAIGRDALDVTSEVHALADMILARDVEPPLVVGVLGGWGTGKSFVVHLLQERFRAIRRMVVSEESVTSGVYVGHPYVVRFDAWTYAKADLWSSLMERIFYDLDRQLTLEQNLNSAGVDLCRGLDIWDILETLSTNELAGLEKELGQEALRNLEKWRRGERVGRSLWTELRRLHGDELDRLERARSQLARARDEQEKARTRLESDIVARLREAEDEAGAALEERREREERRATELREQIETETRRLEIEARRMEADATQRSAWLPVREQIVELLGRGVREMAPAVVRDVGDATEAAAKMHEDLGVARRYLRGLRISGTAVVYLGAGLVAGLVPLALVALGDLSVVQDLLTGVTGLAATGLALLRSLQTSTSELSSRVRDVATRYQAEVAAAGGAAEARADEWLEARLASDVAPLKAELDETSDRLERDAERLLAKRERSMSRVREDGARQLAALEAEQGAERARLQDAVAERTKRAGAFGHAESVRDLVRARIQDGAYAKHLGLLHRVQNDLEELTAALLPTGGVDRTLFPRGEPRVVLFIDDLDRCPPDQVVAVLEAAQLIVSTRLFVVVLAMDVRYVTRSLEVRYPGVLVADGDPSGLDYIEKIVQVPYRVRRIGADSMDPYLRSQLVVRAEDGAPAVTQEESGPHASEGDAAVSSPAATRIDRALQPEVHFFEERELRNVEQCALAVELSPRSTKRVVNVLKLVKNIWYRRGQNPPTPEVGRAIILLLCLSAGYPEIMRRVLFELERRIQNGEDRVFASMREELEALVDEWAPRAGSRYLWEAARRLLCSADLMDSALTLDDFGLANIELVRAFSFVGEVERPVDPATYELGVRLREPLEVATPPSP